jgi:hypothetical protein
VIQTLIGSIECPGQSEPNFSEDMKIQRYAYGRMVDR